MNTLNILTSRNILVTGGASYIGSHASRQLVNAGGNVVVVDNFYSGNRWAVPPEAHLVEGDAEDFELMSRVMLEHKIKEVLETVRRVSKIDFEIVSAGRKEGDPPSLIANTEKIRKLFPWKPVHQDLETICTTAFLWEKNHPHAN